MRLQLNIILFFIFLSGTVLGEKYTIKGELPGTDKGEILLLTRGEHQYLDTIGQVRIAQGKFVMEGEISTACVAMLVTKSRKLPENWLKNYCNKTETGLVKDLPLHML